MKTILATVFLISFAITSCTVVNYQLPPSATDDSQADKSDDIDIPDNIAEAISLCKSVQKANDVPITCRAEYYEGNPIIAVGFPNASIGAEWADAVGTYITKPFCESANKANRQAFLLLALYKKI